MCLVLLHRSPKAKTHQFNQQRLLILHHDMRKMELEKEELTSTSKWPYSQASWRGSIFQHSNLCGHNLEAPSEAKSEAEEKI